MLIQLVSGFFLLEEILSATTPNEQWSGPTIGLLIVVIFDLFSNSILVLFSTKKCSNGGKNERE